MARIKRKTAAICPLKKAEKTDHFVLRFYNATDAEQTAGFVFSRAVGEAHTVSLGEAPGEALSVAGNQVQVKVRPNQVQGIRF